MLMISDKNYVLPQIFALEACGEMVSGTTKPMMIKGVDLKTGQRGQYVVKYMKSERMTPAASMRELLGLWIGKELGLNVVEPVVIKITQEFVDTLKGKDGYLNAQKSIGLNFGSAYAAGFSELVKGQPLTEFQTNEIKDIFAFDMFISNIDRGHMKPNLLSNGKKFLLFDHELAFSFVSLLPFFQNKTPWILGETEREMYQKHYFFNYLKNTNIDFSNFTNKLNAIDDNFWFRVNKLLPEEWHDDSLLTIKNYLKSITENKEIFAEQLVKIIS
jgi:hypothetical protein